MSQTLRFRQNMQGHTTAILSGLPRFYPASFARASNGYVYIATGLHKLMKWNAIGPVAISVGVTAPTTGPTIVGTGSGEITGQYTAYVRFLDADGNVSNLSPVSSEIAVTDISKFQWSGVPTPTEGKVTRRQLLRNTNGQVEVYYVDLDTTDLFSTTFETENTDDVLRNQESVPLFDSNDRNIANRHGVPRNDRPIIFYYNSRLFMLGEVIYDTGNIQVTNGSTTVTGISTEWRTALDGRRLYIVGEDESYEIDSVDEIAQTFTLTEAYRGDTDLFAEYVIRPAAVERTTIYWTEAGQFDSWPATNALDISSSDDMEEENMGAIVTQSFVYILQRRHIYRFSFLIDPIVDGGAFLSIRRGCINDRCWVTVDGTSYLMDDRGIYKFDGGDEIEDVSFPIQDLFYADEHTADVFINWKQTRFFHAVHYRREATIRWYVALSGDYLPRHALCFNYAFPQWWIEEAPWHTGSSATLLDVHPTVVVSGYPRKVFALGEGVMECVKDGDGDTRGKVASATITSLTHDGTITLPVTNLVGCPVGIVKGTGKGQVRLIESTSGNRVNFTQPWLSKPDSTSEFQVGAIDCQWKSGFFPWAFSEQNSTRRFTVGFQPVTTAGQFDVLYYEDFSKVATKHQITYPRIDEESDGVRTWEGQDYAECDLTQAKGYVQVRIDSWSPLDSWRGDFVSVEVKGLGADEAVRFYYMTVDGAEP